MYTLGKGEKKFTGYSGVQMSTSEQYKQIRDLRKSPDPHEPSFSDEEAFMNSQPSYIQDEDKILHQVDRSSHRSCNSCTGSQQRSTRDNTNRRTSKTASTRCGSPTLTKEKRRQQDQCRAKERSYKLESLESGSDRGKIVENATNRIATNDETDQNDKEPSDLSSLHVVAANQQQVVSLTPDYFNAMLSLRSTKLSGPSCHNVDAPCEYINGSDMVFSCDNAWESNDSRKNKTKSICSVKLNRIDLNPNERTKKLALKDMDLCCSTIPLGELCGTPLGSALQRLSLSNNPLREVPPELVVRLPALRILDLSRCKLHQLPQTFNLPNLSVLNLENNELTEFPNEIMLLGLPNLCDLILSCNQLTEITLPTNVSVASKLEKLDLGFNNISYLPVELDQLRGLRHLNVASNCLSMVPMRICEMKLQYLDVSNNNIIKPPVNICELGIDEMRSYWHNIRSESNTKVNTNTISPRDVSRKLKRNSTKSVSLPSIATLSDLSESTMCGEDSIQYMMLSSSSRITEDTRAEEP